MITFTPGRALTPEETTSSSMQVGGFAFLGIFLMFIALSVFGSLVNGGGIFSFIFLAGFVVLGVLALRKAITATVVSSCTLASSASAPLNGELVVDIRLGLLKQVPISGVTLQLRSLAEHIDRNRKNQKSTEVLYETRVMLEPGTKWEVGKVMTGRAVIHIPNDGIPNFKVNSNEVRWELVLDIAIPGWYPDIQKKIPVHILPCHQGASIPPVAPVTFQLPSLGDMNAKVMIMASRGSSDIPALALGKPVKMIITVNPTSKPKANSKLLLELKCNIGADNYWDKISVITVDCFPQGWEAGHAQSSEVTVNMPTNVPISFRSNQISALWVLEARYPIPWAVDRRESIPILVIPGD